MNPIKPKHREVEAKLYGSTFASREDACQLLADAFPIADEGEDNLGESPVSGTVEGHGQEVMGGMKQVPAGPTPGLRSRNQARPANESSECHACEGEGFVGVVEGEPGAYYQSDEPCPSCHGTGLSTPTKEEAISNDQRTMEVHGCYICQLPLSGPGESWCSAGHNLGESPESLAALTTPAGEGSVPEIHEALRAYGRGDKSQVEKAKAMLECTCGEINFRHCPVHQHAPEKSLGQVYRDCMRESGFVTSYQQLKDKDYIPAQNKAVAAVARAAVEEKDREIARLQLDLRVARENAVVSVKAERDRAEELAGAFKVFRDQIEFGPFFGPATDYVIAADNALARYRGKEGA
jgi:hypothetical protein